MNDFRNLVAAFHKEGLKIILEINAAFTADAHEWFESSQKQSSTSQDRYTNAYSWSNVEGSDG